jgi:hypothetical protein
MALSQNADKTIKDYTRSVVTDCNFYNRLNYKWDGYECILNLMQLLSHELLTFQQILTYLSSFKLKMNSYFDDKVRFCVFIHIDLQLRLD